jgi:hypothetical protein
MAAVDLAIACPLYIVGAIVALGTPELDRSVQARKASMKLGADGGLPARAAGRNQDRHRRAVEQSLACAQTAAAAGDLRDALEWLEMLRSIDGALPAPWEDKRQRWKQALTNEDRTS